MVSADVYSWMWSLFPFLCIQIRLKLRSNQYGMSTKQQSFHSTIPSLVNWSVLFPQPLLITVVYFSFWIVSILKSHAVIFSSYLLWTIEQWWQQWLWQAAFGQQLKWGWRTYACTSEDQGPDLVKGSATAVGTESISEDEDLCEYKLRRHLPPYYSLLSKMKSLATNFNWF